MSAGETAIATLVSLLQAQTGTGEALDGVTVQRNTAPPAEIPAAGLVIVRDGDPGDPEVFQGARVVMYSHAIEIEIYAADADQSARDARFEAVRSGIGTVLEANLTLSGTVQGFLYGHPSPATEAVEGANDIKQGVIVLTADYEAASPLA